MLVTQVTSPTSVFLLMLRDSTISVSHTHVPYTSTYLHASLCILCCVMSPSKKLNHHVHSPHTQLRLAATPLYTAVQRGLTCTCMLQLRLAAGLTCTCMLQLRLAATSLYCSISHRHRVHWTCVDLFTKSSEIAHICSDV